MLMSRGWRVLCAAVICSVVLPIAAAAEPITGITLTRWDDTSLTVIVDGTSNTIVFGEASRVSGCVRRVAPVTIVDGSSNTIVFGEIRDVCWDDEEELPLVRGGSSSITDGTSNTILIGETSPYLFESGRSTIDLCVSNPSIVDGTSNTITLPEGGQALCLSGTVGTAAVPEPASGLLLMLGVGGALYGRVRGRRQS